MVAKIGKSLPCVNHGHSLVLRKVNLSKFAVEKLNYVLIILLMRIPSLVLPLKLLFVKLLHVIQEPDKLGFFANPNIDRIFKKER